MTTEITVGILAAFTTLIAAIITNFLNKRRELQLEELKFKLDRYLDFLKGFAEIGSSYKSYEAHLKISNAVNTINLIGSKKVLSNIYSLIEYIQTYTGDNYSIEVQDNLIKEIILAIRQDLGQKYKNEFDNFSFKTISPGIKPGETVQA